jgi:hypothetical protein
LYATGINPKTQTPENLLFTAPESIPPDRIFFPAASRVLPADKSW